VFTPAGRLVTPADSQTYRVGFGDATGGCFAGLRPLTKANSTWARLKPGQITSYFDRSQGYYHVVPPDFYGGAPVTDAFRVYVVRGRDTMFVYPPSIQLNHVQLDSIPFRPGTYRLTDFMYKAAALARPLGLRTSPGPRADWNALRTPVAVMYVEEVANLGARAGSKRHRRLHGGDAVLVRNGQTYQTSVPPTHPRAVQLRHGAAGVLLQRQHPEPQTAGVSAAGPQAQDVRAAAAVRVGRSLRLRVLLSPRPRAGGVVQQRLGPAHV
jgi:hypothetical protein